MNVWSFLRHRYKDFVSSEMINNNVIPITSLWCIFYNSVGNVYTVVMFMQIWTNLNDHFYIQIFKLPVEFWVTLLVLEKFNKWRQSIQKPCTCIVLLIDVGCLLVLFLIVVCLNRIVCRCSLSLAVLVKLLMSCNGQNFTYTDVFLNLPKNITCSPVVFLTCIMYSWYESCTVANWWKIWIMHCSRIDERNCLAVPF